MGKKSQPLSPKVRNTDLANILDSNNNTPNVMSSLFASIDDENEKQRLRRIEEAAILKENGAHILLDGDEAVGNVQKRLKWHT